MGQGPSILTDPTEESGYKPYGSFGFGDFDSVNLMNLQLDLRIPIVSYPQKGGKLQLGWELSYANSAYNMVQKENRDGSYSAYENVGLGAGGILVKPLFGANINNYIGPGDPGNSLTAPDGSHPIYWTTSAQSFYETVDASGWTATPSDSRCPSSTPVSLVSPDGIINCGSELNLSTEQFPSVIKDSNGNSITLSSNGSYFTDSIGRVIPAMTGGDIGNVAFSSAVAFTTNFSGCAGPATTSNAFVLNTPGFSNQTVTYKFCLVPAVTDGRVIVCTNPYSPGSDDPDGGTPYADSTEAQGCTDGPSGTGVQSPSTPAYGTVTNQYFQSLVLPNNTAWVFQYDPTYGDLTSITTPAGGTITYVWTNLTAMQGTCEEYYPYLQFSRALQSRTVNANDGTGAHTWTYTQMPSGTPTSTTVGLPYSIKVTNPDSTYEIHNFTNYGNVGETCAYYETSSQSYSASGVLVQQQVKTYSDSEVVSGSYEEPVNVVERTVSTILYNGNNGQESQIQMDYDSGNSVDVAWGNTSVTTPITLGGVVARRTYDYGAGSPGSILSAEDTTYLWQTNAAYKSAGLTRLVASICDAVAGSTSCSGTTSSAAYTTYGYDESGSPQGTIGNQTSIKRWLNTSSQMVPVLSIFNSNGMLTSTTDAKGNQTSYSYDSTGLFLNKIQRPTTNGVAHIAYYSYDSTTGLLLYHTDENGSSANDSAHTTTYYYDLMGRPTAIAFPDGGSQTLSYNDSTPPSVIYTITTGETAGSISKKVLYDGSGRLQQTQLESDPTGADYADTIYDGMGRVESQSNPYRTKSDPTYSLTTTSYDVLNRVLNTSHSTDGSEQSLTYSGNVTTITDETGRIWKQTHDALGRITQVLEPDGVSGVGSAPTLETDYQYDPLGNLLRVDQWGGVQGSSGDRIRIFKYDSLSRLLNVCNPETISSGSSCSTSGPWGSSYTYDLDGNISIRTDGRGITTNYSYDALNRITAKSFVVPSPAPSDYSATAGVAYSYDQSSFDGMSVSNGIGQRTGMTDGSGETGWSYDSMGRIAEITRTINGINKSAAYSYDKDGLVTNVIYYSGSSVAYANNAAGQAVSAIDPSAGINFVTSATYAPQGAIVSYINGYTASFAGITTNLTYNSRLWLTQKSSSTSANTIQNLWDLYT
jgi:YD repeat-containing protein